MTVPKACDFVIAAPSDGRLATKQRILKLLKDGQKTQLIDARSEAEHCGTTKLAKRRRVPGSVHLEWSDTLDPKTHKFRDAAELTRLVKDAGIDVNRPAITYCQSGGRAAVMAFTLELMGARDVANYYRSWSEWGNDAESPIELKKLKFAFRDRKRASTRMTIFPPPTWAAPNRIQNLSIRHHPAAAGGCCRAGRGAFAAASRRGVRGGGGRDGASAARRP